MNNRFVDITGKKFGWLTVINFSHVGKDNLARWNCVCDCGNTFVAKGSALRRGNTNSCGCYKKFRINETLSAKLEGKKFGKLLVISKSGKTRTGKVTWNCLCDCGKTIIAPTGDLNSGKYTSCGCRKKWGGDKNPKWKGGVLQDPSWRKEYGKQYNKNNRESRNNWKRNRYYSDVNYRIECHLRSRISNAIKGRAKSASTIELLGCSVEYLKAYLESKFDENMSWDNHGSYWEIDHIIPCAAFDLSDPEQQRQCFRYSNLQPLEGVENRKKSDYIDQGHTMRGRNL